MGHVRDLPSSASEIPESLKKEPWSRLGVNTADAFEPIYIIPSDKKKVVRELRSALKGADELYIATDEDREGESIGWHLLEVLQPKIPVRRMVFHEITREAILEALEQHRGWFQLSLLPSLGVTGRPPFAAVLTHGFMVDREGKKMSKSIGNTLNVEDLLQEHGADTLRWWVSSLNIANDVKVDPEYFNIAGEEYRKVRNTLRFLLGNLADFNPEVSMYEFTKNDAASVDAWVLGELAGLIEAVRNGYETYSFRKLHEALFHFCNGTLSAIYLAAVKDRLYCDATDAPRRRRTQAAMHTVASTLIRLLAPILPHTADEAWAALAGSENAAQSVHLQTLPSPEDVTPPAVSPAWKSIMTQREAWLRALETARREREIDNPLDVGVRAAVPRDIDLAGFDSDDLADLLGVSRFAFDHDVEAVAVDDLREQPRCDRSWKRDGTVRERSDGGMLTDRDAEAVGVK